MFAIASSFSPQPLVVVRPRFENLYTVDVPAEALVSRDYSVVRAEEFDEPFHELHVDARREKLVGFRLSEFVN